MPTFLTRRVTFAAAHRYRRPEWSDEQNERAFGACARPNYHGHGYSCDVTVTGEVDPLTGMLVDLAVLGGFVMVALRSKRFWPLWVAGLQLTTSVGHLLKGIDQELLPRAYGAALQFWSYPILVILAAGTYRRHQRLRELA